MSEFKLKAKLRDIFARQAKKTKTDNEICAVVYGPHVKNRNLFINYNEFVQIFRQSGQSTLIDLTIDGEADTKVLIHDIAHDPVSGRYIHVDFYQLDMNKKLEVTIELKFVGESPAVKEKGGTLIKVTDTLEIECLPKDLVKEIDVDISTLTDIDQHIYAKDIKLPAGITLVTDPEAVIISSEEVREEIIAAPAPVASEPATPSADSKNTPVADNKNSGDKS